MPTLPERLPRIDFEFSAGCDHRCAHCYNVWGAEKSDPQGGYKLGRPLPTPLFKTMIKKTMRQTQAQHVTVTGGEPLLRKDALELIELISQTAKTITLITNGSHIDAEIATALRRLNVNQVQLTLLSTERERHNRLKGADCFLDTVRSARHLQQAGVPVTCCFVAMKENAPDFEKVLELCFALGIEHVSYNRMSPTGGAVHHIQRLMPSVEQVEANLEEANRLGPKYNIKVATAMPIPPCLIRTARYPNVSFGLCSTGSESPNIVIDSAGNVRSCNLSSGIMGNILAQNWSEIRKTDYPTKFVRDVPEMCKGCAYERTCQGGCKESAFAVFGDHSHPEPFLWLSLTESNRENLPLAQIESL